MTKLYNGLLFQVVVLAMGVGFVYGAENSPVPEELAGGASCTTVNKLQETNIANHD